MTPKELHEAVMNHRRYPSTLGLQPYKPREKDLVVIRTQCSHFACGRTLTRTEAMAGTRCIKHMGSTRVDPMKVIKFI